MMFEPMELKALTDEDLVALLAALRELATTRNRPALDMYCIVETELLLRHEPIEISDYSDDELNKATACLACAVDASRTAGIQDDYPAMKFLMLNITALVDELERRGMVHEVQ